VKHDRHAVALNCDGKVLELPPRSGSERGQIHRHIREQQLPEPPGVRQIGPDGPAAQQAFDDETVGAGPEWGAKDVLEELHRGMVTEERMVVIRENNRTGVSSCEIHLVVCSGG